MKKLISLIMLTVLTVTVFCSCGAKELNVDATNTASITVLTSNQTTVTLNQSEQIQTVIDLINKAQLTQHNMDSTQLPTEQYRLSLLDQDNIAQLTVSVYSKELLQAGDTLYKGNVGSLISTLESYCSASSLAELSQVFSLQAEDIAEISFYNVTAGTFKLVTKSADCNAILKPLQNLKLSQSFTPGQTTQEFKINVCKADTRKYLPAITITVSEEGTMLSCDGKTTFVCAFNWNTVYEQLSYNNMVIPS